MEPINRRREVTFHHVPVREGESFFLEPDETIMNVEWASDTGYFHAIVANVKLRPETRLDYDAIRELLAPTVAAIRKDLRWTTNNSDAAT